jgi:hypothetical protein
MGKKGKRKFSGRSRRLAKFFGFNTYHLISQFFATISILYHVFEKLLVLNMRTRVDKLGA